MCSTKGFVVERGRYGKHYALADKVYSRSYTEAELASFRENALSRLFQAAWKSKYWSRVFEDVGVRKSDAPLVSLSKLPLINKSVVVQHGADIGLEVPNCRKVSTSGTSGVALSMLESAEADGYKWAAAWEFRRKIGLDRTSKCGYFGGQYIVPVSVRRPPFWRYNVFSNQILFSIYHLSEASVGAYVKKLNDSRPEWIHGYPSALSHLGSLMLNNSLRLGYRPKAITIASEKLLEYQKDIIQRAFRAPVFELYGQTEGVAILTRSDSETFVVNDLFSFVELVEVEPGLSRIVGTNFHNLAFPLFRYDTGDMAETRDGKVISILGRSDDYIVLADGRRVGRIGHIFKAIQGVEAIQLFQHRVGEIDINIVAPLDRRERIEAEVISAFRFNYGDMLDLKFIWCDRLHKTKAGKTKLVVRAQHV